MYSAGSPSAPISSRSHRSIALRRPRDAVVDAVRAQRRAERVGDRRVHRHRVHRVGRDHLRRARRRKSARYAPHRTPERGGAEGDHDGGHALLRRARHAGLPLERRQVLVVLPQRAVSVVPLVVMLAGPRRWRRRRRRVWAAPSPRRRAARRYRAQWTAARGARRSEKSRRSEQSHRGDGVVGVWVESSRELRLGREGIDARRLGARRGADVPLPRFFGARRQRTRSLSRACSFHPWTARRKLPRWPARRDFWVALCASPEVPSRQGRRLLQRGATAATPPRRAPRRRGATTRRCRRRSTR